MTFKNPLERPRYRFVVHEDEAGHRTVQRIRINRRPHAGPKPIKSKVWYCSFCKCNVNEFHLPVSKELNS